MTKGTLFSPKLLTRARRPRDYAVYRAALEWDLTDPIVIDSAADLKSGPRWQDRVTPYHHQVANLITFCRRLPVTLLADDVGLGKTISAGLIVSELISRGRVAKVLVVCPKVLGPQWQEELKTKFGLESQIAIGRDLATADPDGVGAVITTYNSARLHLENIPEDRFQMLILDEAHKLRNLHGTDNPPQVAKKFQAALEARRFRFVLMLTATPIQNRLWDIYSLVDLLTVARGHENPFGDESRFVRKFVEDGRESARHLNPKARDEFRAVVYGYMSRVRRGDAKLVFPDRVVQTHRVAPSPAELELIKAIAGPIQALPKLVQISLLQALVSSPQALAAQLANMARRGSVPQALADDIRDRVAQMPPSSKLSSLGRLIEGLRQENPDGWRLVVFTTRRETQTAIQHWLEAQGLTIGLINGDSGSRNQETIRQFRANPPGCRVIVSTEAGSEGVNLQIANVLVNYDLPWNPMIVEQRIGRIQRLNSDFAHVHIFNMVLAGTFEESIVGRLMEKLQMAAQAIGDIESLLQGADAEDGDGAAGFEERILQLVLSSLAGRDVAAATQAHEESIENARTELARQENEINTMLGSMDGAEYVGPRPPDLPQDAHSMPPRDFVPAAFTMLGAQVSPAGPDHLLVEEQGGHEQIRFEQAAPTGEKSVAYLPGAPAFQRLASRVIASGLHDVTDADSDTTARCQTIAQNWVRGFGARPGTITCMAAQRLFDGQALLRVRATVAHDGYERLVNVPCDGAQHRGNTNVDALTPLRAAINDPAEAGVDTGLLQQAAENDPAIAEFIRFYLERRAQECSAAAGDARKQHKLNEDFTPRLEIALAGLDGKVQREVHAQVRFGWEGGASYSADLTILPAAGRILDAPPMERDAMTGKLVPALCLERCAVSGDRVLRHLLEPSQESGRLARPELLMRCEASGKRVLPEELAVSAVTGRHLLKSLLRKSDVSGKPAEPEYLRRCEFSGTSGLESEIAASEISHRPYRMDQAEQSALSGKRGHRDEFVTCHETQARIARSEAEQCEETGHFVRPGILATCEVSGKRVLPDQLRKSALSGRRALARLFVTSSVSGAPMLKEEAVESAHGAWCLPSEVGHCTWTGRASHPDDLKTCVLTGLHFQDALMTPQQSFRPLQELLDGANAAAEGSQAWDTVQKQFEGRFRGKCHVVSAALSPDGRHLAAGCAVKTLLGFKTRIAGAILDVAAGQIAGRAAIGKRVNGRWTPTPSA